MAHLRTTLSVLIATAIVHVFIQVAPARAQVIVPMEPKVVTPSGVDLMSGQYTYSYPDISIGDVSLVRSYGGGLQTRSKYFANNWSHNLDIYVWEHLSSPTLIFTHVVIGGRTISYQKTGANSFSPTPQTESANQVSFASGKYTFVDRARSTYTFATVSGNPRGSGSWMIEKIVDPNGRTTKFDYASGKLKMVSSNQGFAIVFDYNATGDVSTACPINLSTTYASVLSTCAGVPGAVSYAYTGSGASTRLASVTNALGHVSTVSYDASHTRYVACVTEFGSATCGYTNSYGYAAADYPTIVVTAQSKVGGGTINYSFFYPTPLPGETYYPPDYSQHTKGYGQWQDESGRWWGANFLHGQPVYVADPRVGYEQYEYYWTPTDPSKVIYPEGNTVSWTFSGARPTEERRRDKAGIAANDIVRSATYSPDCTSSYTNFCRKPLSVTDARGGVTNFTYDASHGGMLTQMSPPPTSGAARPLAVTTWTARYAWVKNASSVMVQLADPVWSISTITECQTAAGASPTATCDAGVTQKTTTYEYGSVGTKDALLVKGVAVTADGQTFRTCYGYDAAGNKIWETKPRAGLSTCA